MCYFLVDNLGMNNSNFESLLKWKNKFDLFKE